MWWTCLLCLLLHVVCINASVHYDASSSLYYNANVVLQAEEALLGSSVCINSTCTRFNTNTNKLNTSATGAAILQLFGKPNGVNCAAQILYVVTSTTGLTTTSVTTAQQTVSDDVALSLAIVQLANNISQGLAGNLAVIPSTGVAAVPAVATTTTTVSYTVASNCTAPAHKVFPVYLTSDCITYPLTCTVVLVFNSIQPSFQFKQPVCVDDLQCAVQLIIQTGAFQFYDCNNYNSQCSTLNLLAFNYIDNQCGNFPETCTLLNFAYALFYSNSTSLPPAPVACPVGMVNDMRCLIDTWANTLDAQAFDCSDIPTVCDSILATSTTVFPLPELECMELPSTCDVVIRLAANTTNGVSQEDCNGINDLECAQKYNSSHNFGPPPATPSQGEIVTSGDIGPLLNSSLCVGYVTVSQCEQLVAQGTTQAILCENDGAEVLFNQGVVSCYYPTGYVASNPYQGAYGICDPNYPGESYGAQFVSPELYISMCYWYPYIDTYQTMQNIYLLGTENPQSVVTNRISNGCGNNIVNDSPCFGNGICYGGFSQSYCVCDAAHTGSQCQYKVDADNGDSCDCGVQWEQTDIQGLPSYYGYAITLINYHPLQQSNPDGYAALLQTNPGYSTSNPYFSVASFEQAKYECYIKADCDGFFWIVTTTGFEVALYSYKLCTTPATDSVGGVSWHPEFVSYQAGTCSNGNSLSTSKVLSVLEVSNAEGVYMIQRTTGYNCNDYTTTATPLVGNEPFAENVLGNYFDAGYYYFSDPVRRMEIDIYACNTTGCFDPHTGLPGSTCWRNSTILGDTPAMSYEFCTLGYVVDPAANFGSTAALELTAAAGNDGRSNPYDPSTYDPLFPQTTMMYKNNSAPGDPIVWNVWFSNAWKHWTEVGHTKRYPPNANCQLYPALYDGSTQCTQPTPGCWYSGSGGTPCGAPTNGYCTKNIGAEFGQCSCNAFDSDEYGPAFTNNGAPIQRFYGLACDYDALQYCVDQTDVTQSICSGVGQCTGKPANTLYTTSTPDWYTEAPDTSFVLITDDEIPYCDCDGTGQAGVYCDVNQCGGCSGRGKCTQVVTNTSTTWQCVCNSPYIGPQCATNAAVLVSPLNQRLCSGAGTATCGQVQASGQTIYDFTCGTTVGYPGITTPMCICGSGYAGSLCSQLLCSNSVLVPGHGACNLNTGQTSYCYPPYTGASYVDPVSNSTVGACWQDNCAIWGGSVIGTANNMSCSCPWGMKTFTQIGKAGAPNVVTCIPDCAYSQGLVCGPSTDGVNKCIYSGDLTGASCAQYEGSDVNCMYSSNATIGNVNGVIRTATCSGGCTSGYQAGPNPSNSSQTICISVCLNGGSWNAATQRCDCPTAYAGTTYCESPVCKNNGTFTGNPLAPCDCPAPWNYYPTIASPNTGSYYCEWSTCGDICGMNPDNSFITCPNPGYTVGHTYQGQNGWQCNCTQPFASSDSTSTDCSSSVCGDNGYINLAYYTSAGVRSYPYDWCSCEHGMSSNETLFTKFDGAGVWCNVNPCLHGGTPDPPTYQYCDCPIPYYSIPPYEVNTLAYAYCQLSTCGTHGTPHAGVGCVCDVSTNGVAWSGTNCTTNPCKNGGTWSSTSGCICPAKYQGTMCELQVPCIHGTVLTNGTCVCNQGWVGTYCDATNAQVSSLPSTTPAPTTKPLVFFTLPPQAPAPATVKPTVTPTPAATKVNTTTATATSSSSDELSSPAFIAVTVVAVVSTLSTVGLTYFLTRGKKFVYKRLSTKKG